VAATPDLMLGYLDFFLGGDEKILFLKAPNCTAINGIVSTWCEQNHHQNTTSRS
jgi:hypothetical protein